MARFPVHSFGTGQFANLIAPALKEKFRTRKEEEAAELERVVSGIESAQKEGVEFTPRQKQFIQQRGGAGALGQREQIQQQNREKAEDASFTRRLKQYDAVNKSVETTIGLSTKKGVPPNVLNNAIAMTNQAASQLLGVNLNLTQGDTPKTAKDKWVSAGWEQIGRINERFLANPNERTHSQLSIAIDKFENTTGENADALKMSANKTLSETRSQQKTDLARKTLTPARVGGQIVSGTPERPIARDIKGFKPGKDIGRTATPTDVDDSFELLTGEFQFKNNRQPNPSEQVKLRQKAINMNRKMTSVLDSFQQEEEKGFAKSLAENNVVARQAVKNIAVIDEGLDLVDKGMFAGSFANTQKEFAKFANKFGGLSVGGEKVKNTETFAGLMGIRVGQIIKLFGAGTGLSDADRDFARQIAGGDITVNQDSIKQLLTIGKKLEVFDVVQFNQRVDDFNQARREQGKRGTLQKKIDINKVLPSGKGRQLDESRVEIFLTAAQGDINLARKLATQNGWEF